ncbi:ATP-binding protein [Kiloniella sp. EL199]|uniref:AAA family ATPase n=1 Tax=Kiloniella sp. EL199 TaxID=2107581 RepID=UPI000EA0EE57|nr:ATP-binding protein [Kiloniella sp. EL199]
MTDIKPTLHLVCGKIAAGKSTLARKLSEDPKVILINEDTWLSRLYPEEINTIPDYVRCSGRLRSIMEDHLQQLLQAGLSVVLDFPANTPDIRAWMLGIATRAKVKNKLHYLDVSNDLCKERLHARNASGSHEFAPSDEEFEVITGYFLPPKKDEGLNIILHV